jgi:hypothetical protein
MFTRFSGCTIREEVYGMQNGNNLHLFGNNFPAEASVNIIGSTNMLGF